MADIRTSVRKVLAGVLAAGFLLTSWSAYEHLVQIPHRYCAIHHEIEPLDDHDSRMPEPENGHRHCRWDFLLNLSIDLPSSASLSLLTATVMPLDTRIATIKPSGPLTITLIAPKTSPPSPA